MQITKYPQSTLLIEQNSQRILIDPGNFTARKYSAEAFGDVSAVLLTHLHTDHVDPELIQSIVQDRAVPVIANRATKEAFSALVTQVVADGEVFQVAGFTVAVHDLPHVPMVDGSSGPQNSGFLINDTFFHSGDGLLLEGVKAPVLALPITGPDLSLRDAKEAIDRFQARIVIPVHYSIFSDEKPEFAMSLIQRFEPEVDMRILGNGESTAL